MAKGNSLPFELIFFLIVVVITVIGQGVKWLNEQAKKKKAEAKKREGRPDRPEEARGRRGGASDVLKRFLTEVTGAPPKPSRGPSPASTQGGPRRPQRPPRPHRPPRPGEQPHRPPAPPRPEPEPEPTPEASPSPYEEAPSPYEEAPSPYAEAASPYDQAAEAPRAEAMAAMATKPPTSRRRRKKKRPAKPAETPSQPKQTARPASPKRAVKPQTRTGWIERLPEDPLRRGILFSEILGPPRALRPFGRRHGA